MSALPRLAPKNEWEGHFNDVHGLVEELVSRVGRLEGKVHSATSVISRRQVSQSEKSWPHSAELANQLVELNRKCREELVTRKMMAAHASRVDLDMVRRGELFDIMEELRGFARAEVEQMRSEVRELQEVLEAKLRTAAEERRALDAARIGLAELVEAEWCRKSQLRVACKEVAAEAAASVKDLRGALDELTLSKATLKELNDVHTEAANGLTTLRHEHAATVDDLVHARRELVEVQRVAREDLAKRGPFEAAQGAVRALEAAATQGAARSAELASSLAEEQRRIRELGELTRSEAVALKTCSDTLETFGEDLHKLSDTATSQFGDLRSRITEVDRRERSSWERFLSERQ